MDNDVCVLPRFSKRILSQLSFTFALLCACMTFASLYSILRVKHRPIHAHCPTMYSWKGLYMHTSTEMLAGFLHFSSIIQPTFLILNWTPRRWKWPKWRMTQMMRVQKEKWDNLKWTKKTSAPLQNNRLFAFSLDWVSSSHIESDSSHWPNRPKYCFDDLLFDF